MNKNIQIALNHSFTYASFLEQMAELVKSNKSSGKEQSKDLTNFTKLNQARIKRLSKTQKTNQAILDTLSSLTQKLTFIVLTESWCGDAAQTIPVIYKVAEASDKIDLKIAYRDENLDLMNQFLTHGNQAIPKLIVLDNSNNIIAHWGPRPTIATKMVNDYKNENGGLDAQFKKDLQIWYNKNKGLDTLNDLNNLLSDIQQK